MPWCTIIVRNAFGVAGVVHQPADRFSMRYAWPSAYWGSLPLEGGIEAAYRADIDAADDPEAKLKEIEDRLNKLRSPFRSAEKFWVEEIIDPAQDALAAVRIRAARRAAAHAGPADEHDDEAVTSGSQLAARASTAAYLRSRASSRGVEGWRQHRTRGHPSRRGACARSSG